MNARPGRIDVHHHVLPPMYDRFIREARSPEWYAARSLAPGEPLIPKWTPELSLTTMDELRIERAILSLSLPGPYIESVEAGGQVAREVNEWLASLCRTYSNRFQFFAALPLPDVEQAIAEATYAVSTLGAAGVGLFTNVDGQYLGESFAEPLFEVLDELEAVVFVHPTWPLGQGLPGITHGITDFPLDTTRAAVNLVRRGVITRFPGIRFVLPHGGGYLPYAAYRFARLYKSDGVGPESAEAFLAECRKFYFDTALASSPVALLALLRFADPQRVLFGTDNPYAPSGTISQFTRELDEHLESEPESLQAIDRDNAVRLLGRIGP